MLRRVLQSVRLFCWRRKYRPGRIITHWLAKDVRRDVEVVDCSEIEAGRILGKTRTWNVLYASKGLKAEPSFGEPQQLDLRHLWDWTGEPWGGPVPEEGDRPDAPKSYYREQ